MLVEGLLAVLVILACSAGLGSSSAWFEHYQDWATTEGGGLQPKLAAFCTGASNFLSAIGIPTRVGQTFIPVMIVSFALTTLDAATRINRYIISEFGKTMRVASLQNKYIASLIAVCTAGALAMIQFGKNPTGILLWPVFGISNQILAVLGLSVFALYLTKRKTTTLPATIPMALMIVITFWAMGGSLVDYYHQGNWLLLLVGGLILLIEIILLIEAALAHRKNSGLGFQTIFEKESPTA